MATKSRQRKRYGNVCLDGRASLFQGDDNRNFGNLVTIENAFFTVPDVQNLPDELLARLDLKSSRCNQRHLLEGKQIGSRLTNNRHSQNNATIDKEQGGTLPVGQPEEEHRDVLPVNTLLKHTSKYSRLLPVNLYKQLGLILQKVVLYSFPLRIPQPTASGEDDDVSNNTGCTSLAPVTTAAVDRTILIICAGILSTWFGRHVSMQDVVCFLAKCKDDQLITLLTFMLGLTIYQRFCMRYIAKLPEPHQLTFEDAYGHVRPLSMDVCADFSVLKQFLEVHYKTCKSTAGEALIKAGRFHMTLGSRRGNLIGSTDWSISGRIQPGSRIVNCVFIDSEDMKCLHCQQALIISKIGELHW